VLSPTLMGRRSRGSELVERLRFATPPVSDADGDSHSEEEDSKPDRDRGQPQFGGDRLWEERALGDPGAEGEEQRSPHVRARAGARPVGPARDDVGFDTWFRFAGSVVIGSFSHDRSPK